MAVNNRYYGDAWFGKKTMNEIKKDPTRVNPPDPEALKRREMIRARLAKVPCVYRGEQPSGESRRCEECGQEKLVQIWPCSKHGECSVDGRVKNAVHCLRCDDYLYERPEEKPTEVSAPAVTEAAALGTSSFSPESPSGSVVRESPTVEPVMERKIPPAPRKPIVWAYGVTTVLSRRDDLLPRTLESLSKGGFPSPRLFVDDCDAQQWAWYYQRFGLEVTARQPALRTFGNWVTALWELYVREPLAHRFAIFQDDLVTVRNLRDYLDRVPYPERGYLNLYTFPENQNRCPDRGNHKGFYESNQKGKGAVALVFSQEAVQVLLSSRHMANRPTDAMRGWRAIDGGIVSGMNKATPPWREFVHNPSLVQHTGLRSSMKNKTHPLAPSFPGEDFDALDLFK